MIYLKLQYNSMFIYLVKFYSHCEILLPSYSQFPYLFIVQSLYYNNSS